MPRWHEAPGISTLPSSPLNRVFPGDAGVAHAPDEYVTDLQLVRTQQVIPEFVSTTLG